MKKIGKIFGWLWVIITALLGILVLFIAVYPTSLGWIGVNLSQGEITFGSRVFVVVALWFIFGHNKVTQTVAEVEKAGPLALVVIGIFVGIILEGSKLMAILQKAGFGLLDTILMIIGLISIVGGLIWAAKVFLHKKEPRNVS